MPASKFVLLYSIYSWPNVILCFIGGFLLDRVFGIRWGSIIYMSFTMIGQLLFATGTYVDAFWLMLLGRFLFGYVLNGLYKLNSGEYLFLFCYLLATYDRLFFKF